MSRWQRGGTFLYILGGEKNHAHAAACWIADYEGSRDNSAENPEVVQQPYVFEKRDVTMGGHHTMSQKEHITVDLQESMSYLTSEVDQEEVINTRFYQKYKTYIKTLAEWHEPVDLLGSSVPDELKPLSEAIIREICIHAIHQQRCENYVQLTGLVSLTGVGEARRFNRIIIIANIIRRFNLWGLLKRNEELALELDKSGRKKRPIKRLQGSPKTRLFLQYLDAVCADIDTTKEKIGVSKWKQVRERLGNIGKKTSAAEQNARLKQFEKAIK